MWSSECQYLGGPLKTEVRSSSEALIFTYQTTLHHIPAESNQLYGNRTKPLLSEFTTAYYQKSSQSHYHPHNLVTTRIFKISWLFPWYSCSCIPRGFPKMLYRFLISLTETTCSVYHNIPDTSAPKILDDLYKLQILVLNKTIHSPCKTSPLVQMFFWALIF